jgi:hypothetical protein
MWRPAHPTQQSFNHGLGKTEDFEITGSVKRQMRLHRQQVDEFADFRSKMEESSAVQSSTLWHGVS